MVGGAGLRQPGANPRLVFLFSLPATHPTAFSPDGAILALVSPDGVTLVDAESGIEKAKLALRGAAAAEFSPGGGFLLGYARPQTKPAKGEAEAAAVPNLVLWRVADGARVLALVHRAQWRRGDPNPPLAVAAGDGAAYHMVNNAVNVYDLPAKGPATGVARKLPLRGVCAAAPSPDGARLAAAVPEQKGSPGYVGIWSVADLPAAGTGGGADAGPPPPTARRSFFRASQVTLLWAPSSTALLASVATDTDATNQSYYGDVKLHFLAADGSLDCLVPLPKEGPVHDVSWSPKGDTFVALAGYMPAKATLFNAKCDAVYDLGAGPHALARWSPHGRFLALAGFGNLAGDVAIFDRKADGKLKPCGAARVENGVTCDWAPDGRSLLVATLAPRLRVDNGIRIVKYDGSLLLERPFPVLLEAAWRPAPAGAFPDAPPSPRALGAAKAATAKAARPAAFVPPHLRGRPGTQRAARSVIGANSDDEGGPRKISASKPPGIGKPLPPGADLGADSKAASKNAKRRAAAARKKAEGGDVPGA